MLYVNYKHSLSAEYKYTVLAKMILVILFSAVSLNAFSQNIKLKIAIITAKQDPVVQCFWQPWMAKITKKSGGQITWEPHYVGSSALMNDWGKVYPRLQEGVFDVASNYFGINNFYLGNMLIQAATMTEKRSNLSTLVKAVTDKRIMKLLNSELENATYLWVDFPGWNGLLASTKLKRYADLEGRRVGFVATESSDYINESVDQRWNMKFVPVNYGNLTAEFANNKIDIIMVTPGIIVGQKLYDVTKFYYYFLGTMSPPIWVSMNNKTLAKLSPSNRKIIKNNATVKTALMSLACHEKVNTMYLNLMKKNGVIVTNISKTDREIDRHDWEKKMLPGMIKSGGAAGIPVKEFYQTLMDAYQKADQP